MSWNTPKDFLGKFKLIKPPKEFVSEEVISVLHKFKISIDKSNIQLYRKAIYLRGLHPTERSDIMVQKKILIKELKEKLNIIDIKF